MFYSDCVCSPTSTTSTFLQRIQITLCRIMSNVVPRRRQSIIHAYFGRISSARDQNDRCVCVKPGGGYNLPMAKPSLGNRTYTRAYTCSMKAKMMSFTRPHWSKVSEIRFLRAAVSTHAETIQSLTGGPVNFGPFHFAKLNN